MTTPAMTASEARAFLVRLAGDCARDRILSLSDAEAIHYGDQALAIAVSRRSSTSPVREERAWEVRDAEIRKATTREERKARAAQLDGLGRRERRPNMGPAGLSTSTSPGANPGPKKTSAPAASSSSVDLDLFRARAHASRLRGQST